MLLLTAYTPTATMLVTGYRFNLYLFGEKYMSIQTTTAQQAIQIRINYQRLKRLLDVVFTLLVLPLLCIVMVIVAVLIRLDSPGPIFFRQRRIGQNGVEFDLYKFRSMYINSDDTLHRRSIEQFMADQPLNDGSTPHLLYKRIKDPRVTRVGRFIRKTSIDEIPQFFNVLRGEMSLVGPRPPLPYEVEKYTPKDHLRLSGKPGLTGPWQVYARCQVPFSIMVEMDIAYLQEQSLWQDIKLIFLTIPVMILGRGGA
jgi:lipopolysaccharide/colanic/teichoic acid biosynthesis glycosyltransferase